MNIFINYINFYNNKKHAFYKMQHYYKLSNKYLERANRYLSWNLIDGVRYCLLFVKYYQHKFNYWYDIYRSYS